MVYFAGWKVALVLAVCTFGIVFTVPNFLSQQMADNLPEWLPHRQISLGLDLQGGSHLLLEVKVDVVVQERLSALVDSARIELRRNKIGYRGLSTIPGGISFTVRDPDLIEQARGLVRALDPGTETEVMEAGRIVVRLTEQSMKERRQLALGQSIEIIRRRIDETGVREPTIQRQGDNRILVQLPGVGDPDRIKRLLGKTAKLNFRFVDTSIDPDEAMARGVPPGSELLPSDNSLETGEASRNYLVKKRVMVGGDTLVDSQPTFDQGRPVVSFRFDTVGGKRFGEATRNNVGKAFAIVLDKRVISAPVIREPILGGAGIITGSFSVQEANDLALLLRAGALPAPLTILEERTVGPGLGADSIRAGKIASVVGLLLVLVFMALYYGLFGLFANVALLFNMVLIAAALSVLQATLTLPGIAGIVLTIGMAVDANVLIFERIREEVNSGRTPISAIDTGYKRALTTIIDSNVTTLIAAILLFEFGSGPIKGFAVTLALGIASSMFTAIMLTRLLVVTWLRRRRPQKLPI
jgi:preprotein translocase subunit SecD